MPLRVHVPTAPGGRSPIGNGGRRSGRGPGLIGAAIALVIVALLILIALPVGGLILLGFGGYIGVLAHRARAHAVADPLTLPMSVQEGQPPPPAASTPAPKRKFFGLEPSYGLSATCVIAGILMFFGGAALLGSSDAPQNQTAPQNQPASSTHAPTAAAVLPTTTPSPTASSQPVFAAPQVDSTPAPATEARQTQAVEETQPITAPVENTARPQPVAPQPAARDDGGAVYYKNCTEARAAGAAPLHKGEPGYRPELDRDHDGTACE